MGLVQSANSSRGLLSCQEQCILSDSCQAVLYHFSTGWCAVVAHQVPTGRHPCTSSATDCALFAKPCITPRAEQAVAEAPWPPRFRELVAQAIVCGDGIRDSSEACDDGNNNNSDGCSSVCVVEDGWVCDGAVNATSTCNVSDDDKMETWAIVVAVVGSVLGAALLIGIGVWVWRRKAKSKKIQSPKVCPSQPNLGSLSRGDAEECSEECSVTP